MNIIIKPLVKELNDAYLDFFDNRAFSDGNPNGPCYCTSANQTQEEFQIMVNEFECSGIKHTLRKYAAKMLEEGRIHGYLAFDGNIAIGWCNASDTENYTGLIPDFARKNACGKTLSIVCFEIAPEYRGRGIASMFIEHVCKDAQKAGYDVVEGYAKILSDRDDYDFFSPVRLYEKAGFYKAFRADEQIVMRKLLNSDILFKEAMRYIYGEGVAENNQLAAQLLAEAHSAGHTEATYNMGICYHYGYGVAEDLKTAYELYLEAANSGYGKGMELVGRFYNRGIYVAQDRFQAEYWLKKAMESQDTEAIEEAERELKVYN